MTAQAKIDVIKAQEQGKKIQAKMRPEWIEDPEGWEVITKWEDTHGSNVFNFSIYDYRVKPEPREFLLVPLSYDTDGEQLYGLRGAHETGWEGTIHVREIL